MWLRDGCVGEKADIWPERDDVFRDGFEFCTVKGDVDTFVCFDFCATKGDNDFEQELRFFDKVWF